MPELQRVTDMINNHTGHARKVLEWLLIQKRVVAQGKDPGYSEAKWAPLAELAAVDEFERVGNYVDVQTWPEYVTALTKWAKNSEWDGEVRRITERPDGAVLLETIEQNTTAGHTVRLNSVSVYEVNAAHKIKHLGVFVQMPLPPGKSTPF